MKLYQLFSHWNQIHADTLSVIEKFSDAELHYRAYEDGFLVGEIALHIADAEEGWFRLIATQERDEWPADFTLQNYPNKEAIKTLLSAVHAKTKAYLKTLTLDDLERSVTSHWGEFTLGFIIWHVLEHEIHHRGELSLILGILGRDGLGV